MKKNIYMIIVMSIALFTSCSMNEQQEIKSIVKSVTNEEEMSLIKNMELDGNVKLGDLVDAGVGSPTYELYDPAEDGNTYITIKGNITYNDIPMVVALQYKKVSEENYEFYTITYNDVPQNELERIAFFNYLYEVYNSETEEVQEIEENEEIASSEEIVEQNTGNIYLDSLELTIREMNSVFGERTSEYDYNGGYYVEYDDDGYRILFVTNAFDVSENSEVIQTIVFNPNAIFDDIYVGMDLNSLDSIKNNLLHEQYDEYEGIYNYSFQLNDSDNIVVASCMEEKGEVKYVTLLTLSNWEESFFSQ